MHFTTHTEVAALVLTVLVHLIGAGALIYGMIDFDDPNRGSWRDWWPRDDRGDGGPGRPDAPEPSPQGGGLPIPVPVLDESRPAPGRVREGTRIGDLTPRPSRRPAHPPLPAPVPDRTPAP